MSLIVIDCHLDVFHELFLEVVPPTVAADTAASDNSAPDESASPTVAAAPATGARAASGEPATKQARLV